MAGRYPFTPGSPDEVQLSDFGRIFGDGGVFDTFFTTHLEQLVDKTHSSVDVASWGSVGAGHTRSV